MKIKNKKGQVGSYIVWFIGAIFIITFGAIVAPLGTNFNAQMYLAGEDIIDVTIDDIIDINDNIIRNEVNASLQSAKASAAHTIEINANMFQYSWILFLIISTMIIFLSTRRSVEFSRSGGGFI